MARYSCRTYRRLKQATFSAIPPEDAAYVFMTSGTTRGIKGKNYHLDLDVYDLAMTKFLSKRSCLR